MAPWKKGLMLLLFLLIVVMAGICITVSRQEPEPLPPETTVMTQPTQPQTEPAEETLPLELPESEVPLYFQTDYPYVRYGNGTIGTSGCSITSLAMVATYMTGREYFPDELAYHFGSYGVNNIERLEYGIQQLGLPCEQNYDWQVTKNALKEGKVAIIMVDQRTEFSTSQHFMVLTGITEQGRILVHDPYGYNYRKAHLKEGFREGFREGQIVCGLEGSWVFDREAMDKDAELFDASLPPSIPTRYPGFTPTEHDKYLLASFAWAAARKEPLEAQQAVVEVVLNRMVTGRYPDTVDAVMKSQDLYRYYEAMTNVEPEVEQYLAVTNALYGPALLEKDVLFFADWNPGCKIEAEFGKFQFYTG